MRHALIALALAALAPALPAAAQAFRTADVVTAELRPGWRTETGTHMAALHLRLAEGWKTYWRTPGDAGIPPRFDWSGSANLSGVRVHWPRPEVFELAGMRTLGFSHELVLPLEFTLSDAAAAAQVSARVDLGVCETICVPVTLQLEGALPAPGVADPAIRAALADRPLPAGAAGLTRARCSVSAVPDGLRLTARLDLPAMGAREVAVFELSDEAIWISEVASHREGGTLIAAADLVPIMGGPVALDRSDLRITVLGDGRAVELQGCPAP